MSSTYLQQPTEPQEPRDRLVHGSMLPRGRLASSGEHRTLDVEYDP